MNRPNTARRMLLAALFFAQAASSNAEQPRGSFATNRAELKFIEARHRFHSNTNDAEAAWELARATFDLAELARNDRERERLANQGIAAARSAIDHEPASAAAHYYLGMNLGQLARTRTLGALRIVDEIERAFKNALALDQMFDFAGPHRNLGLLYLEAPALASVGDKRKARTHLQRAVELAPDYPENWLNLIEALLKWGEKKNAETHLVELRERWPAARETFAGPDWAATWRDWENRLRQIESKSGNTRSRR